MGNNIYVILNVLQKRSIDDFGASDMVFMVKNYQVNANNFRELSFKKIEPEDENISDVYECLENFFAKSYGAVNGKQYVFLPIADVDIFNKLLILESISAYTLDILDTDPEILYKALKNEIKSEMVYLEDVKVI